MPEAGRGLNRSSVRGNQAADAAAKTAAMAAQLPPEARAAFAGARVPVRRARRARARGSGLRGVGCISRPAGSSACATAAVFWAARGAHPAVRSVRSLAGPLPREVLGGGRKRVGAPGAARWGGGRFGGCWCRSAARRAWRLLKHGLVGEGRPGGAEAAMRAALARVAASDRRRLEAQDMGSVSGGSTNSCGRTASVERYAFGTGALLAGPSRCHATSAPRPADGRRAPLSRCAHACMAGSACGARLGARERAALLAQWRVVAAGPCALDDGPRALQCARGASARKVRACSLVFASAARPKTRCHCEQRCLRSVRLSGRSCYRAGQAGAPPHSARVRCACMPGRRVLAWASHLALDSAPRAWVPRRRWGYQCWRCGSVAVWRSAPRRLLATPGGANACWRHTPAGSPRALRGRRLGSGRRGRQRCRVFHVVGEREGGAEQASGATAARGSQATPESGSYPSGTGSVGPAHRASHGRCRGSSGVGASSSAQCPGCASVWRGAARAFWSGAVGSMCDAGRHLGYSRWH